MVNGKAGVNPSTNVVKAISQGIGQLKIGGGTCLMHVIATNAYRIKHWHFVGSIFEYISNDAQRWQRWVDIGIPHHKLFEDIILDCSGQFIGANALLFGSDDIKGHNGDNGAVHGHGNRHFIKRDAIEEYFHILNGINGYPGFSNITNYSFMVGVVTAVGGQVESHGKTLLPGCKISPVKCIRFFGGGKTSVLPYGPWASGIHRGIGTTQVGG